MNDAPPSSPFPKSPSDDMPLNEPPITNSTVPNIPIINCNSSPEKASPNSPLAKNDNTSLSVPHTFQDPKIHLSTSPQKSFSAHTEISHQSRAKKTPPHKPLPSRNHGPTIPRIPIITSNRFGPLLRSSRSNSSSSWSGPLFPPGFEDFIPLSKRCAASKKQAKKKLKKRSKKPPSSSHLKSLPSSPKSPSIQNSPKNHEINIAKITPSDVMELASKIGLTFNGPKSDLMARIDLILSNQKKEWEKNLP